MVVCLLFMMVSAAVSIVLPGLVIYLIIKWLINRGKPRVEYGMSSAQSLTDASLKARFMEEAKRNAAAVPVGLKEKAGPAEVKSEQPSDAAGRHKIIPQGEGIRNAAINKLALVHYMQDAAKAGQDEASITSTLIAKGWPKSEVADAFRSFQLLRG